MSCPFCNIDKKRIVDSCELVYCVLDAYPVSNGHTLVIPKRHVSNYFEMTDLENAAVQAMLGDAKVRLSAELDPQGFNIGINIGRAAGQTIDHVHVHLIPRYEGDMFDPRGGVRGVIPSKQKY